jgi:hypothetical protein
MCNSYMPSLAMRLLLCIHYIFGAGCIKSRYIRIGSRYYGSLLFYFLWQSKQDFIHVYIQHQHNGKGSIDSKGPLSLYTCVCAVAPNKNKTIYILPVCWSMLYTVCVYNQRLLLLLPCVRCYMVMFLIIICGKRA